MILAFDLLGFSNPRIGWEIYKRGLKKGILIRPLGNAVYFMPPYVITREQVEFVVSVLDEIIGSLPRE